MTRYFFHVRDGANYIWDHEGTELPGLEQVRPEALAAARELLAEKVKKGLVPDGQQFVVATGDKKIVAVIRFSEAIGRAY